MKTSDEKLRIIAFGTIIIGILAVLCILLIYSPDANADQLYNPYTERWESVPDQRNSSLAEKPYNERKLKYNPYNESWAYERPDARLEYNPYEDTWGYEE